VQIPRCFGVSPVVGNQYKFGYAAWALLASVCALAMMAAAPVKGQETPQPHTGEPPDVVNIEVRELSRVIQSPPVMGVMGPREQSSGARLQASGTNQGGIGVGQPLGETRVGQPETGPRLPEKYDVAKIGDRRVGRGFDLYSLEREQQLGKELASQVEQSAKLLQDPVITEYVNRIGQNLVRNSDARVPFTIKVIDNDEVNAFALPGGFFYVNTGLILAAENEAELAGVMAHEIAHVAARHATKNATRSQLFNLLSIPLIFVGGPAGYAVRQVVGLAVPMSFLKFSRDAEREADMLGLEYQYASGYDPEEFVRFFEKLHLQGKQKKQGFLARAFLTHPMTGDRIKRAQQTIEKYLPAKNEYIVDTSDFDEVKARLLGVENTHKIDGGEGVRPTLRKRPEN
jgi:beta-barrel assembly-enhancing protease